MLTIDDNQILKFLGTLGLDVPAFKELRMALTREVYDGPFGADWWTNEEPLEHYKYVSLPTALDDLRRMLDKVPSEIFYDADFDEFTTDNPWENPNNWSSDGDEYDEVSYRGPWEYRIIVVALELLDRELLAIV